MLLRTMSTEVACNSDVTVGCLGEGNQNKSDADRPEKPDRASCEEGQRDPQVECKPQKHGVMESEADGLSTNDKENEQNASSHKATETDKKRVIEAPPPKVNPWTKRNPCPATNSPIQPGTTHARQVHVQKPHCRLICAHMRLIHAHNSIYVHAHVCSLLASAQITFTDCFADLCTHESQRRAAAAIKAFNNHSETLCPYP